MATTFVFEELDEGTRDYLTAVRDSEGLGSPGVFVATSDSLPGCGCIAGPIIIIVTLLFTLTTWINLIYDEPLKVACIQTAGIVLGGWLLMATFRAGKGNSKIAGTWVYVDPLYLYEAFREQVTVTPVDDVTDASFTHNYNNGNYTNSVVTISLSGSGVTTVTLNNEARAEQMVVYLNYLSWARGTEGGARASLPPATLGGLAKYVAKNDHEPLDAESNINLNMIELDITEVPEQPTREGRAVPALIPYIVLLALGALCFFFMGYVVNPALRDDAIFEEIMKEPYVEPSWLRRYLNDSRNTKHREAVTARLSRFYEQPVAHARSNGTDTRLGEGFAKVLDSVRTATLPVVSVRVTEQGAAPGTDGTKAEREKEIRTQFVLGLVAEFSKQSWGQPIRLPEGNPTPPPIGEQLVDFIEIPEGATAAHIDITYTFALDANGRSSVSVTVAIRTNIEEQPVALSTVSLPATVTGGSKAALVQAVRVATVQALFGYTQPNNVPNPGVGGGF
jgi:hypothetical protein